MNVINDYLKGRKQRTTIGGSFSTWRDIIHGVPQGSVLKYENNYLKPNPDKSNPDKPNPDKWHLKPNPDKSNPDKWHLILSNTDEELTINIGNE